MLKALNAQSGRWTHICCKSYDEANIKLMWQLCTLTASLFDFSFTPTVTSAHPDPGLMVPEPSIDSPVPAPCEIGCQSVKLCPVSNQSNTYSLPNTWSCVRCQKYPSSPGSCWWLLSPSLPPSLHLLQTNSPNKISKNSSPANEWRAKCICKRLRG